MKKNIQQINRTLSIEYIVFLTIAIAAGITYEFGWLSEGQWAGDARLQYVWSTISVLATLSLVPLSLKLYNVMLHKQIANANLTKALKLYRRWNEMRLVILALTTYLNIYVYYATLENIGGLCALICLTASAFCIPSENKLKNELNINNNDSL